LPAPLPFRNLVARRCWRQAGEHEAYFRQLLGIVEESTAPVSGCSTFMVMERDREARLKVDAGLRGRIRDERGSWE